MKIASHLIALTICLTAMNYAQGRTDITLPYGGQRLTVPAQISTAKEGNHVFILAGREVALSGKTPAAYGIQVNGKGNNPLSQTLIELRDGAGNRTLGKISAGEFFGNESSDWKILPRESGTGDDKAVSAFSLAAAGQHLKFYRTVEIVQDEHLPGGKGLMMTFAIKSGQPAEMSMRFMGASDGWFRSEEHSCVMGDAQEEQKCKSMIVLKVDNTGSLTPEGKPKKGEPNRFVIQSPPVKLIPDSQTTMISFLVAGTTIGQPEHARKQADDMVAYFTTRSSKPDLAALTTVDRQNTNPGDTVLYTIAYHNIGTAAAKDITINNPVPVGTDYIENTVEGDGGTVNLTRSPQNSVTSIEWKFGTQISPGDFRSVRFKVIVR